MPSKYKFDTTAVRSSLMSKIRSGNTTPELILRKALWKSNLRFRIHNETLFGKPDISIKKYKIVIFIDGEFWHGYNWEEKQHRIKANRDYWIPKIERNIKRDREVDLYYSDRGWTIFRFWQKQILRELDKCVSKVLDQVTSAQII